MTISVHTRYGQRPPGRVGVGASLVMALAAIPIILACGATPMSVAKASANTLTLNINITDQPTTPSSVLVQVAITVSGVQGPVILSSAHALTCNGVKFNLMSGARAQVPRQPPGGAYTFVYTDEHGQHTTLVVPVPRGAFAITSPVAGASIKLPQQPSLEPSPTATGSGFIARGPALTSMAARDATPGPPATPTPPATQFPSGTPTPFGQVRTSQQVSQPPILIRYTIPSIPANGTATFQARAMCGRNGTPTCAGNVFGPTLPATGTYALTDAEVAPGYGFEAFGPGAGELSARFTMSWALAASGFHAAQVTFDDGATVNITWTR